jgi:hypothetical protein
MYGSTRDLVLGSEIAGYRIDAVAGRGGMGVVYRATDVELEREVALKLISRELTEDDSFRERFKRESRLAASIRHPCVVTVFRAGEEDGLLYIAMDYVEGTDLKALLRERGRLDPRFAAVVIGQVASALDAAHAKALVHRDVKPANVLVAGTDSDPHAYLTDFGLTKDVSSESGMTQTGMMVGTLDYVAPEQIEGGAVDARADVYALGCMTYEVLAGRVPYPRDSSTAKIYAHLEGSVPSLSDAVPEVPRELDGVVARAMAKRPDDRYPSAGDVARALRAAIEGREVSEPEHTVAVGAAAPGLAQTRVSAAPPATRRRRWPIAAGIAGLVAVAALVALLVAGGGGSDGPKPLTKDQDRVLDVTRPFAETIVQTESAVPRHVKDPADGLKAAEALAKVRKAEDQAIVAVERITPPTEVKDLHAQLLALLRQTRSDVADAGAAADRGNDEQFRASLAAYGQHNQKLDSISAGFAKRGYNRLGDTGG